MASSCAAYSCIRLMDVVVSHAGTVRGRAARREQMPAHQIEGVAQLAARRVGRVMGKGVLVVVHDQPARGAATHEGVAVVLCGRGVPVGEDVFEDVGNRMRPAERPDDAALGQRVFLLETERRIFASTGWVVGQREASCQSA